MKKLRNGQRFVLSVLADQFAVLVVHRRSFLPPLTFFTITEEILARSWLTFIVNKRTETLMNLQFITRRCVNEQERTI